MKKYLFPLLLLTLCAVTSSCSKDEDAEVVTSTYISDLSEPLTEARFITNINSLMLYTAGIDDYNPNPYNYISLQFEGNLPLAKIVGSPEVVYLSIVREYNYYNQLWTMKADKPRDAKCSISKSGDIYTINLTTPTLTDEQNALVPARTFTYKGKITEVTMLTY